jgi:hypothetical protein
VGGGTTTFFLASAILARRSSDPIVVGAEAIASWAAWVGMCLYGTFDLVSCTEAAFLCSSAAPLAFLSLEKNFMIARKVYVELIELEFARVGCELEYEVWMVQAGEGICIKY